MRCCQTRQPWLYTLTSAALPACLRGIRVLFQMVQRQCHTNTAGCAASSMRDGSDATLHTKPPWARALQALLCAQCVAPMSLELTSPAAQGRGGGSPGAQGVQLLSADGTVYLSNPGDGSLQLINGHCHAHLPRQRRLGHLDLRHRRRHARALQPAHAGGALGTGHNIGAACTSLNLPDKSWSLPEPSKPERHCCLTCHGSALMRHSEGRHMMSP